MWLATGVTDMRRGTNTLSVGLRCTYPTCGSVDPDPPSGYNLNQFVALALILALSSHQCRREVAPFNHLPSRCSSRVAVAENAKQTTRNGPAGRSATAEIAMAATTAAMPLTMARARM